MSSLADHAAKPPSSGEARRDQGPAPRRVLRDAAPEHEADRAADAATSAGQAARGLSFARVPIDRPAAAAPSPASADSIDAVVSSPGQPLDGATRSFMEPRFGHDFGRVRIHTGTEAARSARALHADAYTTGNHVVFNAGQYAPHTPEGRHLLAHELAHTRQQSAGSLLISLKETPRERATRKLEAWAATKDPKPSVDPKSKSYAFTLQEYEYGTTHKDNKLIEKPKKEADIKKWEETFADAHQLALMILESKNAEQKETRAGLIAQDLAQSRFITDALDIAGRLTEDNEKANIYELVVPQADAASAAQLETVSKYYTGAGTKVSDNPFVTSLADRSGAFAKALGKDKLLALLKTMLSTYKAEDEFIEMLAQVLVFSTDSRVPISEWLWTADKDYLFSILDSKWFVEPGYGGEAFTTGSAMTMAGDMPWVYTYKQKYYVNWLVELAAKHKIDLKAPKSLKFADIKTWLDANTEKIGSVLSAEHPKAPEEITKVYQHIADIFFFHVDRGDVKPDLGGKLAGLGPADPSKMRLKADCDVLATYAGRLLKSAGFDVVGYMALVPSDSAIPSHAVALLTKDKKYYIVNNKQVTPNAAASKAAALVALRDNGLGVFTGVDSYKIYYQDAKADGSMTKELWTTDESTRRTDLEPKP
jgi:hypothetical protein